MSIFVKHKDDLLNGLVETKIPLSSDQFRSDSERTTLPSRDITDSQEWGMTSSRREAACWRELGRLESIQGVHDTVDISFTARERKTRGTREKR